MHTEIDRDIPKYKKKTKSNTSKSKSRSNHKHQKKECLLIKNEIPYLTEYCTICGKIIDWNWCLEKCEGGYRVLNKAEAFTKYAGLEHIVVDDLFVKYISVDESK